MPKFNVCLGRLVREQVTVVVEASSKEDLESRLGEVYDQYDGLDWAADTEWGYEPSDSHTVVGEAKPNAKVQITLSQEV